MTLDPNEAGTMLQAIAGAEKRTREFLVYARAGDYMILWGVLWLVGYGLGDVLGAHVQPLWWALDVIGIAGTAVITWRASREKPEASRFLLVRPLIAIGVLIAFGNFWMSVAHVSGRAEAAFWPSFCGALLFCFGLWAGRTLSVAAAIIVALVLAGYFWAGAWFDPWLAVTCGGALILGGLWLRR